MKALSSREGCEAWTTWSTQRLRRTMFIPDVKDEVEDATAVMQRQVRDSQTIQRIVRIPRCSAQRDQGGSQIEYVDERRREEEALCGFGGTQTHRQNRTRERQAVLYSADEGKDNRADRRRLRLLVLTSTFRSLVFGRPEETLATSWT